MKNYKEKYGEYALITGASSGIGREFAWQIASLGLNLILVARRKSRLNVLAGDIKKAFDVKVVTIGLDLLKEGAIDELVSCTRDLDVGLLIPNAGMEVHGDFVENGIEDEANVLKLNAMIPMQLVHTYGAEMKKRKRGGIVFVSSTFGHQSVPYFANYAASKAYILSIGQSLNYELKKSGIDVTVLSPGLTKTEMIDGMKDMNFKKMPIVEMHPRAVVRKAIKSLGKKQIVIPGTLNVLMDILGKYTSPRWMLTNAFGFLVSRAMK